MQTSALRFLRALKSRDIESLITRTEVKTVDIERYKVDWFGRTGQGEVVACPGSVHELSSIVKFCSENRIGITILGGNTGLVGASLSGKGELIVSLEKLNKIVDIDDYSQHVTVEAGVILEDLQKALAVHGLITPHDLGARGSCTIGGNVATNAGGVNYIRYGPLRGHVIGLEGVLANGEIIDSMSQVWKDNSGIDVKQLFIGSEGALGVISKVRLHCPRVSPFKTVAFLHCAKPFTESVLQILDHSKQYLGETLSAFEFFDSEGASIVGPLPQGIASASNGFSILVEAAAGSDRVRYAMDSFLESLSKDDAVTGVVASDTEGMKKLWKYREDIPVKMARLGPNLKYDVSVPQKQYYNLVDLVRFKFGNNPAVSKIAGYGHVGDGNLHLNIALKTLDVDLSDSISDVVYAFVTDVGGSISAEHGIGRDKLSRLGSSKSGSCISTMKKLKNLFDPHGILNPGRTIPTVKYS